jgi:hypothetical protein
MSNTNNADLHETIIIANHLDKLEQTLEPCINTDKIRELNKRYENALRLLGNYLPVEVLKTALDSLE